MAISCLFDGLFQPTITYRTNSGTPRPGGVQAGRRAAGGQTGERASGRAGGRRTRDDRAVCPRRSPT